ncbi:MAG: ribonuclease HIII [Erysipelothrix sp.]|nr:ribonuclease HIII [Erysipelothrix sp.]
MSILSIELSNMEVETLKENTKNLPEVTPPAYAKYAVRDVGLNIVVYNSNKVVFQGEKALAFAKPFEKEIILPQAGSDETGNGSYFGPICVCAAYIDKASYDKIKHLNLTDSKAVNDQYIMEIGQFLRDNVIHSLLVLDNHTYNKVQKTTNQNKMKAILHNQAFINLEKQVKKLPKLTVIDQFTPKTTYFKYLVDEKVVFRDLIFETKAESKYLSVAVGSIIARFAFVSALKQMSKHYNFSFLSGAGNLVDVSAQKFVDKYGKSELSQVAKVHFVNTKRIK